MNRRIAVIGAGPGGYVAALQAAALGADVTLVERNHLGGTCLNWGCIPSKIMKHAAQTVNTCKRAGEFGILVEGSFDINMAALNAKKDKIISQQRAGIAALLKGRSIKTLFGSARILSNRNLEIKSDQNGTTLLDFDQLIISTGTAPVSIQGFAFDHQHILSSNDLLNLKTLPKSILIIGAGVIGCEFAFILSSLGVKVTLVEGLSRVLPFSWVDEDISRTLAREMKKHKINVICDAVAESPRISDGKVYIDLKLSPFTDNPNPKPLKIKEVVTHQVGICVGRAPDIQNLGLENVNVQTDSHGWIVTDAQCRTSSENIFAIGDILGPEKIMLAHVASHEGMVAAKNAVDIPAAVSYDAVPSAIFTMPEIGTVGLSEQEALKQGFDIRIESVNFRNLGKAQAISSISGFGKLVIDRSTGRIIGVHLIGPNATDLLGEGGLAVTQKITASQVADTIHAHPTLSEIYSELALKAMDCAVHG